MDDGIEKDDPVAQSENEADTESTSLKDFELVRQYESLHALWEGNILLGARTLIIKAIMNQDTNEVIDDEISEMNMDELNELTAKMSLIDQGWMISTQSSVAYELLLEGRVSPETRLSFPYGDVREHILQLLQMSIPENAELLQLIKIRNEKFKELYLKKQELQSELNKYKEMIEKHRAELKARVTESEEVVRRNNQMLQSTVEQIVKDVGIENFTVTEVRLKVKNLCNTYNQELNKIEKSGIDTDVVDSPSMKRFKIMHAFFLEKTKEKRATQNNLELQSTVDDPEESTQDMGEAKDDSNEDDGTVDENPTTNQITRQITPHGIPLPPTPAPRPPIPQASGSSAKKGRHQDLCAAVTELRHMKESLQKPLSKDDEFDTFGQYIALRF